MTTPFETAAFFSLSEDVEQLAHEDPRDAIGERFDYGKEPAEAVTVFAWARKPLPVFGADDADYMIEHYEENNLEEWLVPDGDWHVWQGEVREEFKARLVGLFAEFREKSKPWSCEVVAQRDYTYVEVLAILGTMTVYPGRLIGGENGKD